MGLFDFLKTKRVPQITDSNAWFDVTCQINNLLWHFLQNDPKVLIDPYTRIILRNDWKIGIANSKCDPSKILGAQDVAFVLLQENHGAYKKWGKAIMSGEALYLRVETESFSKILMARLQKSVEVI
jgi:hypothetical protein